MLSYLLIISISFLFTWFVTERTGLFTVHPSSILEILYSIPFLAVSTSVLVITALLVMKNIRKMSIARWFSLITVVMLVGGLWLSYLTRFSVSVVLTEGQTFFPGDRRSGTESIYVGRLASVPDFGVELEMLEPEFSADGQSIRRLEGRLKVYRQEVEDSTELHITDRMPGLIGGALFAIHDFGYSVRYTLKSKEGRVLDSSFMYMRLFPPGSEDSFRLLSPLTYYVRYYPDGKEAGAGPVIGLRIARNKDIVFNDNVQMFQDVSFENSRIAFEEVRRWTKLCITRDWGMIAVLAGIIAGAISFPAVFLKCRGKDLG